MKQIKRVNEASYQDVITDESTLALYDAMSNSKHIGDLSYETNSGGVYIAFEHKQAEILYVGDSSDKFAIDIIFDKTYFSFNLSIIKSVEQTRHGYEVELKDNSTIYINTIQ